MTVAELIRHLEKMPPDLEVRAAPLIDTEHLSGVGFRLEPHPERQYKVVSVHQDRNWTDEGAGEYGVVLGFEE